MGHFQIKNTWVGAPGRSGKKRRFYERPSFPTGRGGLSRLTLLKCINIDSDGLDKHKDNVILFCLDKVEDDRISFLSCR